MYGRIAQVAVLSMLVGGILSVVGQGLDNPSSYGEVAQVDTPIIRIPLISRPPKIDGTMDEGEWEDAAAFSGFWYDYGQADFRFLAPQQTQLQIYAAFDKENLYIAYSSPVFPENSWLRARGRFPDVTHHPQYGLIWDDHIELELRPVEDNAEGFRLGLFKWFVNPFNMMADYYWSVETGDQMRWQSGTVVRNQVTATRWTLEMAIPLASMASYSYAQQGPDGRPLVTLPPPDGTAYRCWFTRGIGGNATFFNVFDKHSWNTTKAKLIFDSNAPVFQINELGPIMDDMIDVQMTVKNHNTRSETVRLGFFVESQEGLIYSSYDAPELSQGLLELRPGEVRKLRLRKPFPGISRDGNTLWFDVRSAGRPAKVLFRTRLIDFHSMDGGETRQGEETVSFRERRVDVIASLRPPRRDFEFTYEFSSYKKRLQGIVDIGIHGASEEAKQAVEAKLTLMKNDDAGTVVATQTQPFVHHFACLLLEVPEFENGVEYKVSLLLFDRDKRIVGERNPEPFVYEKWEWQDNQLGLDDVVWEPFVPIVHDAQGLTTLKHRFTLADSGLPAQIFIQPAADDLPLEARAEAAALDDAALIRLGRGPQLRAPLRFEVQVGGQRLAATSRTPARVEREWQSELEYLATLAAGPLAIELRSQYDCDGALHCTLVYGSDQPVAIDSFEMIMEVAGPVDLKVTGTRGGGMAGADVWECTLPNRPGVVWDSADIEKPDLYYSHFVPWLWFGSGDRGFSWFCDSDRGWVLDRDGGTMTLERNAAGELTWRVKFVNHPAQIVGQRTITFTLLTHPSKPKPTGYREKAWLWRGGAWADEYIGGDFAKSDADLLNKARIMARVCDGEEDLDDQQLAEWTPDGPVYWRYYQLRGFGNIPPKRFKTHEMDDDEKLKAKWDEMNQRGFEFDQHFEDKVAYWFGGRHVPIGRRHGWWWDETWPVYRSSSLAEGIAYLRPPEEVAEDELPWQDGFLTGHMRNAFKRLARMMASQQMPNRNFLWANNEATCFESFAWDASLVEECGGIHRTFEVDALSQFPNSLYRYLCHNWTGLITRVVADSSVGNRPGDDPRLDRQWVGLALLHDIGYTMTGPHGQTMQKEQVIPLLNWLADFGFFAEADTEKIPFWRSGDYLALVDDSDSSRTRTHRGNVEITVYRRPLTDGRRGFKALIVILNETNHDVELPLRLLNAQRLLGGNNTLQAAAVRDMASQPPALEAWWQRQAARQEGGPVLMDVETGDVVTSLDKLPETYGPLLVKYHNYRLLYAEHADAQGE